VMRGPARSFAASPRSCVPTAPSRLCRAASNWQAYWPVVQGRGETLHAGLAGFTQSAPTTRISVRASQSNHTKILYSIVVQYRSKLLLRAASVTERSFSETRYGAGPTRTVDPCLQRLTHVQVQLKAACDKEGAAAMHAPQT
jgi:hypothetical protein